MSGFHLTARTLDLNLGKVEGGADWKCSSRNDLRVRHSERIEESSRKRKQILRFAQDDFFSIECHISSIDCAVNRRDYFFIESARNAGRAPRVPSRRLGSHDRSPKPARPIRDTCIGRVFPSECSSFPLRASFPRRIKNTPIGPLFPTVPQVGGTIPHLR